MSLMRITNSTTTVVVMFTLMVVGEWVWVKEFDWNPGNVVASAATI